MTYNILRILAGSAILALSTLAARADLITNPNFDQPGAGAETHENAGVYLVGSSGWQALGTASNPVGGATYSQFGAGYNGATYYGELNNFPNATGLGGWQQVINTNPGQTYTLSFAYNYLSPADNTTTSFTASALDGAVAYTATPASSLASKSDSYYGGGNFGVGTWDTDSFQFTALSSQTTIRFASTEWHTNAFGPAIDAVSVTPEPVSLGLLLIGGAGLLARRRRA